MATLLLIATIALADRASAVTYEPEPAFCESTLVRDYLKRLPRYSFWEPEPDGSLDFGPPAIRMKALPRLVAGSGKVGYRLFLRDGARTAHPRWKVKTILARVHMRQNLYVFVDRAQRRVRAVGRGRSASVFFEVPDEPAYYAVSVHFANLAGRSLGRYRFYFRVVPVTTHARLALNASSFPGGSAVFGRLENFGTATILYGAGSRIERFDGVSWSRPPELPSRPVPAIGYLSHAGETSRCFAFDVPPGLLPGRYRMVKEVDFFDLPFPSGGRKGVELSAEFDVTP